MHVGGPQITLEVEAMSVIHATVVPLRSIGPSRGPSSNAGPAAKSEEAQRRREISRIVEDQFVMTLCLTVEDVGAGLNDADTVAVLSTPPITKAPV